MFKVLAEQYVKYHIAQNQQMIYFGQKEKKQTETANGDYLPKITLTNVSKEEKMLKSQKEKNLIVYTYKQSD